MLFRYVGAGAALALNLSAFTLSGTLVNQPDGAIGLGITPSASFDKSLIGKMTHKKLIECTPNIDAVYEYGDGYLHLYLKKPLIQGINYSCVKDKSSINFYSGDFIPNDPVKYTKDSFLISFNDEVSEDEFVKNFKIYERDNLSKHDIKYKISTKTSKSFSIKLLEDRKNPIFFLAKELKSSGGTALGRDYEFMTSSDTKSRFIDDPNARTLTLTQPKGVSLDEGKLGIRLYLNQWVDDYGLSKFIKIDGVKNFKLSEISYIPDNEQAGDFYYYIDVLSDEFKPNTEYKISYLKGFGDRYNMLREDNEFNVKFGDLKPFLKFSDPQNATYLSSIGEIGIESVNTSVAKVVVEKLPEQNYRYFLNFNGNIEQMTKEVASKNYELGGVLNELSKHKIKLDFAGAGDGVYLVTVYYDKDKSAQKVVYLTDIGASIKVSKDEVFLFANRLSQNAVIANADVKIYSHKNEVLASGITNDEGVFKFSGKDIGKEVASATITLGKEQGFISVKSTKLLNETAYFPKKEASEDYDAYVHFASNIVRPQENIKGEIIIKNRVFSALANMPIKLVIKDPQNKIVLKKAVNTDELGVINFDEKVNSNLTGTFNLYVEFASQNIAQENFSVESFTPQRIKNSITPSKTDYKISEPIELNLQSAYLFGAPAGNLNGNVELNLHQQEYKSDKFKDYSFSNAQYLQSDFSQLSKPVSLDKNGKSQSVFKVNMQKDIASIIGGAVVFNINDDGKNISASQSIKIYPFDTMVGIRADRNYIDVNEKINFSFVSIDPLSGEEIKDREKIIEVRQAIWDYNVGRDGVLRWNSTLENIASFSQATNEFSYTFTQSGSYDVVVTDVLSGHKSSVNIDVSGWDYGGMQPTKELAKTQIKLNQKSYKKGDVMSVDVSSALKNAIGLVTLESNGVKKYKILNIQNNTGNAKFDLDFDFEGLYVSASIMRVADNSVLPFRAYNKIYAKAEHAHRNMDVSINTPKIARSNSKFKVDVKAEPNSSVTLFAVDEGILQITSYKLKNPLDFFNAVLIDSTLDYDIYDSVAGFKKDGKILSFGGDMAAALMEMRMAKFASPVDKKNIQTYIKMYESKADANGNASFEVEVPNDFNSKINLAALAKSKDKLGFSISEISVKDDIILKPTQTAYLIAGDKLNYALRVINTTNEAKEVNLSLETNLNVKLASDKISLKPNENLKIDVLVDANQTGKAFLNFKANDGKESYTYSQKLDVIHPYPLSTYAKSFQTSQKQILTLDKEFKNIRIDASSSIKSLLGANSDKLISYPYGCAEQRSSKLLELNGLLLSDSNDTKAKNDRADVKRFITQGMLDVIKMQKIDGSFGYWNELSYTNNFASIYAIHVLFELEKSGFELDKQVKANAVKWLSAFSSNNSFQNLYAAYILSTQNKLERSAINALYDKKEFSTALEQYLMAAILKNAGLNKESNAVLQNLHADRYNKNTALPDDFGSNIRNTAFMLLIHARHFEKNALSDEMASYLIKNIDKLYSTQERAFSLAALREYMKNASSKNSFKLISDGKELNFDGLGAINITPSKPELEIVPQDGSTIYLSVTSSAYKPLNIRHEFNKKDLDIYRTFVDKNGKEIDINALKLNDVIYSKLTLKTDNFIRNGVINETISPCFEVVNENLTPNLRTRATINTLSIEHQNIEDDRVLSFYSLNLGFADEKNKTPFAVYTPLRVISSGKCMLPAVITENMYDESDSDYDLAQTEFIVK